MSQSFIEKSTAEPTRRAQISQSSPQKNSSSQSPSTKSKVQKDDKSKSVKETASKSTKEVTLSKKEVHKDAVINSPPSKKSKSKEIDNAVAAKDTKSNKNTKQSSDKKSNQALNGTPMENKLVERTNSNGILPNVPKSKQETVVKAATVTDTFSPRKTRSRAAKNVIVTDAQVKAKPKLKLPQFDGANDIPKENKKSKAKTRAKPKDLSSDDDFDPVPVKKVRNKITPQKIENKHLSKAKQIDRRVFSTDEECDEELNTNRMNFWVEAYSEAEKKWVVIDPVKKKVDCPEHVRVSYFDVFLYKYYYIRYFGERMGRCGIISRIYQIMELSF